MKFLKRTRAIREEVEGIYMRQVRAILREEPPEKIQRDYVQSIEALRDRVRASEIDAESWNKIRANVRGRMKTKWHKEYDKLGDPKRHAIAERVLKDVLGESKPAREAAKRAQEAD